MRFLCKKCGAQSPGDLSEVAVRDGALVFTCKTCGASATLVENHEPGANAKPVPAEGAETGKGVVEPDEAELVELGQATISRMLGRKVRIVDDSAPEPAPVPAQDPEAASASLASAVAASGPPPVDEMPVLSGLSPVAGSRPETVEPTLVVPETHAGHGRFVAGVAAGLVLAAAVTFALVEARQPAPSEGDRHPKGEAVRLAASGQGAIARDEPRKTVTRETSAPGAAAPKPAANASVAAAPPARSRREEPSLASSIRELGVEKSAPQAPHPSVGPAADHLDEAFRRVRPGVRMCALQEKRRNADARLGDESVTVTFAPTGEVLRVSFASAGLEGTPLGECLAVELRKARVEPFEGQPAAVHRVLSLAVPGGPEPR